MDESNRTRSRASPDWTVEESLILVNEINAVESEWGTTLSSFQKWQQIVQNCNSLDVSRNLNQCKRKWDALLTDYRRAKNGEAQLNPVELFNAIHICVCVSTGTGGENDAVEDELAIQTDPDSDPEAQGHLTNFILPTGSDRQRRRMKRKKRGVEPWNPWGYFTSTKIKLEECTSTPEQVENTNDITENTPEENNTETKEQIMATMLLENALQIKAIVEGKLPDDVDYTLADLKNAEAVHTDCIRRQGDKLIDCLGKNIVDS